jgi:ATP-dependent DNA helicase PIF1
MLSAKLLDGLELICRKVRGGNTVFGGLQMVLVGDFYQLPPVPNARYQDEGQFAFQSPLWEQAFLHKMMLKYVHRQQDGDLIQVS